jgi:hypothetical protein
MGYKPVKKLFALEFTDFPGLEVNCTSTSLGKLMHIAKLDVKLNEVDEEKKMEVFNFFAANIHSWNVVHPELDVEASNVDSDTPKCSSCGLAEDDPLPPTVAGLMCLDLDFVMVIIFGWMAATSRVSGPKGLSLSDGEKITETMMKKLEQLQSPLTSPMLS